MDAHKITMLGESLPQLIKTVKEVIIPRYEAIGSAGAFALLMMRRDLEMAEKATAEQDTVQMIRAYNALKGYRDA